MGELCKTFQAKGQLKTGNRRYLKYSLAWSQGPYSFKSWKEDVSEVLECNCQSEQRYLGQMQVFFLKEKTGSAAVIFKCSPQTNASLHTVKDLGQGRETKLLGIAIIFLF